MASFVLPSCPCWLRKILDSHAIAHKVRGMTQTLFPFVTEVDVRGYEVDSFGHVNNAVYAHYLEHARWSMGLQSSISQGSTHVLPVVRHLTLDYRAEALLGDRLRICLWPKRAGNTSFVLGSSIRIVQTRIEPDRRKDRIILLAQQVLACIDENRQKAPIPDAWRQLFPEKDPGEALPPEA